MRTLVGVAAGLLIALVLAEFVVTILLPQRVKRGPRFGRRAIFSWVWLPWRALARRLPGTTGDTFLGLFGPIGLLALVTFWAAALMAGFAGLHWANASRVAAHGATHLADDVYFSASAFFNSTSTVAHGGMARVLRIAEAATGYLVLFVVIGYLPALFQAYSRREVAVSQLDPRAGSPPSASRLLQRSGHLGGWQDIDGYLAEWEQWAAELMETHLSYPLLAYYRSQHVNQNWLAALTTVLDTSAFAIAVAPAATPSAEVTFAIGRHALADLAYAFRVKPGESLPDRLSDADWARLRAIAAEASLELTDHEPSRGQLDELRAMYEPYAIALSRRLELPLPAWVGSDEPENWRLTAWRSRKATTLH
ncbi:MAG TPA: hypothetical protein VHE14_09170 [Solirubrobacteraceae bacterium]|nr:hypothetical protein [Solirubrobacteraceae bacterium]